MLNSYLYNHILLLRPQLLIWYMYTCDNPCGVSVPLKNTLTVYMQTPLTMTTAICSHAEMVSILIQFPSVCNVDVIFYRTAVSGTN